jgi:peroxidase
MDDTTDVVSGERAVARSPEEVVAPLGRLLPPAYADGVAAPRPSPADAERVAFEVFTQGPVEMPSPEGLSALWIFWGQFLDHDIGLSPEQEGPEAEFIKFEGPGAPFNVLRSEIAEGTGTAGVPAEQVNAVTPLVDASQIYGSDLSRQQALRTLEGGRLKAQPGPDGVDLPPDAAQVFGSAAGATGAEGFTAGDLRAQENSGLAALHALWINEHNHWADRFAAAHPGWTDEQVFQAARAAVEALVQRISYEAFLPLLIGDAIAPFDGHDPEADPRLVNEFSTAAFRFGHTAIPDRLTFLAEDGAASRPPAPLFEAFENDAILEGAGASALLRGALEARAQALDATVVDSLNFLLFTPDGGLTGFSLPERNILRGRDHGLETWAVVRETVLGDVDADALAGSADFSVITPEPALQAALASVYPTVGAVDLWVGGLAEPHAEGAAVGPTFRAIIADQLERLRDADPLFHAAREWADPRLASEIAATTLADVLTRSGGIGHVQRDPFLASARQGGAEGADHLKGSVDRDLLIGFGGNDYLKGAGGADDLFGDAGADMLSGGFGPDGLTGGAGGDKLIGGAGADRLSGGEGSDLLVGGPDADVFVFEAGEGGMDCIADFRGGEDRIELRGFGIAPEAVEIAHDAMRGTLSVDGVLVAEFWGRGHWELGLDDIDLIG